MKGTGGYMAARIGELLIKSGFITEKQVDEAVEIQKGGKKKLGEILIELGYIVSRDLIRLLSEQAAIPFVELRKEILDDKLIKSFPEKILYNNTIIPLYETEDQLYVAIGDPASRKVMNMLLGFTNKEVVLSGAEPAKIIQLLDKFFLIDQTEGVLGDH